MTLRQNAHEVKLPSFLWLVNSVQAASINYILCGVPVDLSTMVYKHNFHCKNTENNNCETIGP